VHEATGIELAFIPAGEFMMGAAPDQGGAPDEGPPHRVRITRPFYIGKCEVTQAQWLAVMGYNPSRFQNDPRRPVETVSWNDVQEFLARTGDGLRLPTEAEWEYACRAGSTGRYYWGDSEGPVADYENVQDRAAHRRYGKRFYFDTYDGYADTAPVGSFKPNAFGLHDMIANVSEWCQDWYDADYYRRSPTDDPQGPPEGEYRVLRGGCWDGDWRNCRSAVRYRHGQRDASSHRGFRVVVSP
jgi:formylglycine-generating enzyme required for sulfatase activity